jgi:hypothetical protein
MKTLSLSGVEIATSDTMAVQSVMSVVWLLASFFPKNKQLFRKSKESQFGTLFVRHRGKGASVCPAEKVKT